MWVFPLIARWFSTAISNYQSLWIQGYSYGYWWCFMMFHLANDVLFDNDGVNRILFNYDASNVASTLKKRLGDAADHLCLIGYAMWFLNLLCLWGWFTQIIDGMLFLTSHLGREILMWTVLKVDVVTFMGSYWEDEISNGIYWLWRNERIRNSM